MTHPLIGKIVRYESAFGSGPTALFRAERYKGERLYGEHIMGGLHNAHEDNVWIASKEDIELWKEKKGLKEADSWDHLVKDAIEEALMGMTKFPQPNYVITKIYEEAGEVGKEALHCAEGRGDYKNLRKEMKQTIAMLYRLWVEGDQVHGCKPVREEQL